MPVVPVVVESQPEPVPKSGQLRAVSPGTDFGVALIALWKEVVLTVAAVPEFLA
jgi:hypothetical protein